MKRASGFTLLELMVAVGILGILAAVAGPPLGDLVDTTRVNSARTDIQVAMQYARTEAVRRRQTVYVMPINDEWSQGWFVSTNNTISYSDCGTDSACLQVYELDNVGVRDWMNAGPIAFNRDGRIAVNKLLIFCDEDWSSNRTIDYFYWYTYYGSPYWVTNYSGFCSAFAP